MTEKKLFIGDLSWDTTDEGLRAAFEAFGEVSKASVITDRETGRSRGFGFVTYPNGDEADKAIAELNGTDLDGKNIKVEEAKEREPRRSGGGGGGGFRGGGGGRGGDRGGFRS